MIYRLRHATRYRYQSPVDLGAHLLRLTPRPLPWQRVAWSRVAVSPAPARRVDRADHFGNQASWVFLDRPHPHLDIVLEAEVEVAPRPAPAGATPDRQAVAAAAQTPAGWAAAEHLFASPMVPILPEAAEYAAPFLPPGLPVLEGLLALNAGIRRDFTFCPDATTIATPLAQVLRTRRGVCQDFSHAMICALRGLGLPARYVSGYIRTRPPPGRPRLQGADQSHAWVGCWLGPEHGWIDLDPTNAIAAGDEHVTLGWGRDYGDVSPARGVLLGGGAHALEVQVDLEPV